ncbi:histone-lysine N-methyltransferase SETMAR [Trichonephila clavipes]|nr:histone-lysine N-methyltransferase SETMAR [Trichonephila clavipes]
MITTRGHTTNKRITVNYTVEVQSAPSFFFDKDENTIQAAEIVNGVYGADTATTNCVQFWFRRFRSDIFDVKDAPHTGKPVVENVDKIAEIIEIDQPVVASPRS